MKVTEVTAFKRVLLIEGAPALDPIHVILIDEGHSGQAYRGRICVFCFGRAWAASFGAMSNPIHQFIATAPEGYLADKLGRAEETLNQSIYLNRICNAVQAALKENP